MTIFRLAALVLLLCFLETAVYLAYREPPPPAPRQWLTVAEARQYIATHPGLCILDVRTRHEFSGSHLPGAVNMPLYQLPRLAGSIPSHVSVLVVDMMGGRATQAYKLLRALRPDIAEIRYVKGGLIALPAYKLAMPPE